MKDFSNANELVSKKKELDNQQKELSQAEYALDHILSDTSCQDDFQNIEELIRINREKVASEIEGLRTQGELLKNDMKNRWRELSSDFEKLCGDENIKVSIDEFRNSLALTIHELEEHGLIESAEEYESFSIKDELMKEFVGNIHKLAESCHEIVGASFNSMNVYEKLSLKSEVYLTAFETLTLAVGATISVIANKKKGCK